MEPFDFHRHLLDTFPLLIWQAGKDAKCVWFNRAWLAFTNRTMEQECGDGWTENVHPYDLELCLTTYLDAVHDMQAFEMEYRMHRHDGVYRWVHNVGIPIELPEGQYAGYIGYCIDITDRKHTESVLRFERDYTHNLVETMPAFFVALNADLTTRMMNATMLSSLGYTKEEVVGCNYLSTFAPKEEHDTFVQVFEKIINFEQQSPFENYVLAKDNTKILVEWHGMPIFKNGRIDYVVGLGLDITARKEAENRIEFLAHHDPLTGLPNRLLFKDRLDQIMAQAHRQQHKAVLMFLDLDKFKSINDSFGHGVGDKLIQEIAARLREFLRETDSICRQGGDEFLIALAGVNNPVQIAGMAEKMLCRLSKCFHIDGHCLSCTISLGISVYPDDGLDFETLVRKADIAMYTVKSAGRNGYHFFSPQMNYKADERLYQNELLRKALEREEFVLYYQPRLDLSTGKTVMAEALLRWNHPEQGLTVPEFLIPDADAPELAEPLGIWELKQACFQAVKWRNQGWPDACISVRLSDVQFKHGCLSDWVTNALGESGLPPSALELEIAESALFADEEGKQAILRTLKAIGVILTVRDFGTGYSNLAWLQRFNLDKLKIDRSLLTGLGNKMLVSSIIQLVHAMKMKIIVESLEEQHCLDYLQDSFCDEASGDYFCEPLPSDGFDTWLKKSEFQNLFFAPGGASTEISGSIVNDR